MFEFAISNQRRRPPSGKLVLALVISLGGHVLAAEALVRYPALLGSGLRQWFIKPIFFTSVRQEEPWRTVAILGRQSPMIGPSAQTLKQHAYDWNAPHMPPPIRLRWGGPDENQKTASSEAIPATKPVMGTEEPKPQGIASGMPPAGTAAPPSGGTEAGKTAAVYLPPPQPKPEPREIPKKAAETDSMTAPTSIPKADPSARAAVTAKSQSATPPAQIFEDEQKAIRTEGSGLFDTKGFPLGDYASLIIERIKGNWFIPSNLRNSQGRTTVIFFISRDGRSTDAHIVVPSGSSSLDLAALSAILGSNPFPPLPRGFPGDRVGAKFVFSYNERQ